MNDETPKIIGNLDYSNNGIYLLYLEGNTYPVAAYVGGAGEYDAYYDFINNYCGSPLADINAYTTAKELYELIPTLVNDGGWDAPIHFQMESLEYVEPVTGLSIKAVQDKALEWALLTDADEVEDFDLDKEIERFRMHYWKDPLAAEDDQPIGYAEALAKFWADREGKD